MLPGIRSLAAALQLEIYWVYTLHLQAAALLAALTPVTELSMLPGIRSLAAALQLEIYWVYTLHL
ncbi:hypothetical protein [Photorhabdus asymbiotica]|uniref:hypothetical protein n=1 Tax=Photorhabdus asymbiotica TaxID=291112 RepID=UPI003DA7829F